PRRNPENAMNRKNVVIDQMVRYDYLSEAEGEKYKQKPIKLNYAKQNHHSGLAPYFRQVLEQEMKSWSKKNEKENGEPYNLYRDVIKIYTTIDPKMQRYAEEDVSQHLKALQTAFAAQPKIKNGTVWKSGRPKQELKNLMQRSERYLNLKETGMSEEEIIKN